MKSFHCQRVFLLALLRYIRVYTMGKARRRRTEQLLGRVLRRNGITNPSRAQLRHARAAVKAALKPGPALISRYEKTFLVGRSAQFTYADVERIIQRRR